MRLRRTWSTPKQVCDPDQPQNSPEPGLNPQGLNRSSKNERKIRPKMVTFFDILSKGGHQAPVEVKELSFAHPKLVTHVAEGALNASGHQIHQVFFVGTNSVRRAKLGD